MASVKQLKKDIDNQVFELISDCFLYAGLHPDGKAEEVSEIIEEAVALRNDLVARANNPAVREDPKAVKKHYQAILSDLGDGVNRLCGKLSSISKKKKK